MVDQARLSGRLWVLGVLLLAAACGSPPAPATPRTVAVQQSDVPKGMIRCGESGDVDQFMRNAPAGSSLASQIQQDWQAVKSLGVKSGIVYVYAASKDQCTSAFTAQSLTGTKLALNMVLEFKNSATAAKAYANAQVGTAEIAAAPGAEQGSATGLGPNSLTFGDSSGGQAIYFGYWQNGRFLVLLLTVGIAEQQARQDARNVNSRIH